ncbi:hypothetical protein FSP39_024794 [Pinctada imbricata]|uniref:G-protein coupled receptors family 1 profile domain-containing protein n=1 Tax=Pinctada imbricata TaxID=66713 RepID=A0AA88Y8D4_PINIB|nr:hypothetical protein FSP39_024794 [Pinctada imbricata]
MCLNWSGPDSKMVSDNLTITRPAYQPKDGYDIPVYGLANGQFYSLHVPALTFIFLSLTSAIAVLVASFKLQSYRSFFSWTKSERFVVYLAVCDGLFSMAHSMDHLHIVITKNHVYPRGLCKFYGFMLTVFITAQNLMVNIVAFNAFILIYYRKNVDLGRYDYRLLLYTFGTPFVGACIAVGLGTLGSNGAFCYFDGVKGELANIFFTTIPLILILCMNIVLYCLTLHRINTEEELLKESLGNGRVNRSHKAARNMSMFVVAFFVQWCPLTVYGLWQLIAPVPQLLFQMVTTFSNIGGILNGIVFIILKRRKLMSHKEGKESSSVHMKDISINLDNTVKDNADTGQRSEK